jgi:hypothetical protein
MSFLLSLNVLYSTKSEKKRQNRFYLEAQDLGGVRGTMYAHISKCKNDKIKGEKN